MKSIDSALLMGLPIPKDPYLLHQIAEEFQKSYQKEQILNVKVKLDADVSNINYFGEITGQEIKVECCPSLQKFNEEYFMPNIPLKLISI